MRISDWSSDVCSSDLFLHEGVEMHAALAGDRRSGKEEIHQHRLAGADIAEDVEALRRIDPAPGEAKARLPADAIARRTVAAQGVVQRLQLLRRQQLAGR